MNNLHALCRTGLIALAMGLVVASAHAAGGIYQRAGNADTIELGNTDGPDEPAANATPVAAPAAAPAPATATRTAAGAETKAAGAPAASDATAAEKAEAAQKAAEELQATIQHYRDVKLQQAATPGENTNPATGRKYLKVNKSQLMGESGN